MAKKDIEVSPYGGSDAAHTVWPLLLPRSLVAAKSTSVLIIVKYQAQERSSLRIELCLWITILCSNARAPVVQLVRASDRNSEDPGWNPGWISMNMYVKLEN